MADPGRKERKLVREIPVVMGLTSGDGGTLLQYPLRPRDRPYERAAGLRTKRGTGRLEAALEPKIAADWKQYDKDASIPSSRVLRSSPVDLKAQYAVGYEHGGVYYLLPVASAKAMRPTPVHPSHELAKLAGATASGSAAAGASESKHDVKTEEVALSIQVRRRETEKQTEARVNSHSYLRELEAKEEWVELEVADAPEAESLAARSEVERGATYDDCQSKEEYMERLVAGAGGPPESSGAGGSGGGSVGEASGPHTAGLAPGANATLSRRLLAGLDLKTRVRAIFAHARLQVFHFRRLQRLVPPETDAAELLSVLKDVAVLVQGCWVGNKETRMMHELRSYGDEAPPGEYDKAEARVAIRHYALLQFARRPTVSITTLQSDGISVKAWRPAVVGLAEGADGMSWKFVSEVRARAALACIRSAARADDRPM